MDIWSPLSYHFTISIVPQQPKIQFMKYSHSKKYKVQNKAKKNQQKLSPSPLVI